MCARFQKFSVFLYLQGLEWENTGLVPMFVLPQPLPGKMSLAIVLRKDVNESMGRKLWPQNVEQRS